MSRRFSIVIGIIFLTISFGNKALAQFVAGVERNVELPTPDAARQVAGKAVAAGLTDSFFLFNRKATTPTATYAPGKVGAPIEIGAYLVSAAATGPTGTVTINLGLQSCIATLVPENPAIFSSFNIHASTAYCTITPSAEGTLMLSGTYDGDASNTAGPVGQFISTSYPMVPILSAAATFDPAASYFVATSTLPDYAVAGESSERWMVFTSPIPGTDPTSSAITVIAAGQTCNSPALSQRTFFASAQSEKGFYTVSMTFPVGYCTFNFAQTGFVDVSYAFAGDSNYVSSLVVALNSIYVLQAGSKHPVLVRLSVSPSSNLPLVRGATVPITASVLARDLIEATTAPPQPTGTVTIRVGSTNCTGQLSMPSPTFAAFTTCSIVVPMTGDLTINATYSGDAYFASDTALPRSGGSPAAGSVTYSGTSPTGGAISASIAATGATSTCRFTGAQILPLTGDPRSPSNQPPSGYNFQQGLFDFTTNSCLNGATPGSITVTLTYAAPLPAGTVYFKYGPTATNPLPHWYLLPSIVAGNTLTFTITDGGLGDDDLAVNGAVVDMGGPVTSPNLDIDLDGNNDALTDGLVILRYLFGLTGTSLTTGAIGSGATMTDSAQMLVRLNNLKPLLDVDGNGQSDALTDGLILIRYFVGIRGSAMVQGAIGQAATRNSAADITTYIDNLLTPLSILTTSPPDLATAVSPNAGISVTFNKPMAPASITATPNSVCMGSIQLSADNFNTCIPMAGLPQASSGNTVFSITPAASLATGTTFRLRVTTEALDGNGVPLTNIFTQANGFTTGPV